MIHPLHLALAGCLVMAPAAIAAQADPLLGVWVSETTFGDVLPREVILRQEGGGWSARIDEERTAVRVTGDSVRFAFAGRGEFRGVRAGDSIAGWWIRPPTGLPGGVQPFASPLVIRHWDDDSWRGGIFPLRNRFTLYLSIFHNEQGVLTGAFRNPELNSRGGASQFRVAQEGDSLRFSIRPDTTRPPEVRHTAHVARSPDRIHLFWPDLEDTIELTRATPAQLAAYLPRPPGRAPYTYQPPQDADDGWPVARAGEMGMDEDSLTALVRRIIGSDPAARRPMLIHSVLVAHRGTLVLEEYFSGHDWATPHDVRSAGKTLGSVMLGAAMMQGIGISPQTRIYPLLAGRGPFANPDPRKERITLAHLLTHTSGLACDDNDDASPGNEGTMQTQTAQPDWWKYTLDLPMAHEPGARYAYCSANSNLVGAALTEATGTWLPELFQRTVAGPLGFGAWHWNLIPNGEGYLGGGAYIRPRDLLKVGQVFMDGGVWKGRRIVDSAWIALSTAPHVEITPASTGLSAEDFPNFYGEGRDGYAWHVNPLPSGGRAWASYEANGNGGQVLVIVPEAELVVLFTGGNYGQGGIWGRWRQEIIGNVLIPALRR